MNYIQETASSCLCLGIKRNNAELGHDERPSTTLKEQDFILNTWGSHQFESTQGRGWLGRRQGWQEDQVGGSSNTAHGRWQGAEAAAARSGKSSRVERGHHDNMRRFLLFLPMPVQLLPRLLA